MAIFDGMMQGMTEEEKRKRMLMEQGLPMPGAQSPQLNGMGAMLDGLNMADPLTAFAVQELLKRMGG